jgi:hypothetical protein
MVSVEHDDLMTGLSTVFVDNSVEKVLIGKLSIGFLLHIS